MSAHEPASRAASADDTWLYAWGGANVAIGASSLLVPLYVVQLGGDAFALGVLWFATSLAMVPGALGVGRLADRTGRRRSIALVCFVGLSLSLAAVPVSDSVAAVVVADAALWLFIAGVTPILTLLVLADAPERRWNARVARLNRYQDYGWTGGLVVGAVWTLAFAGALSPLAAQRLLLGVSALGLLACAVAAARWLPADSVPERPGEAAPSSPAPTSERVRGSVRALLSPSLPGRFVSLVRASRPLESLRGARGSLGAYFVAVAVFFAGFSMFSAPLPDFLTGAGFGDGAIFALYVVSSLASAASYVGAGELADRYDLRLLQSGALSLRGVVFPAVAVAGYGLQAASPAGFLAVGALFAAVGLSWAVIAVTANTLVARYAGPSGRGAALGLYTALSSAAGGVGGLVGGWLATTLGYVVTFAVAGALVFVGCGVVIALRYYVSDAERSASSSTA